MSAFGQFLGSSGGSQAIAGLIGLGGGLVMSNQQKQNAKKQSNDAKKIAEAQIKAQELAYETAKLQAQQGGGGAKSNTGLYVGLGIGGVVVLGLVVFLAVKKQ
jgi:guanyl-specific ribonuclease Sa